MPDYMSPEKSQVPISSSVQAMASWGKSAELPGAADQLKAAQEFPQYTSISESPGTAEQLEAANNPFQVTAQSELPDIRMQARSEEEQKPDLTKEMMDWMRSQQGRIQTSELLKLSEGLDSSVKLISINAGLEISYLELDKNLESDYAKYVEEVNKEIARFEDVKVGTSGGEAQHWDREINRLKKNLDKDKFLEDRKKQKREEIKGNEDNFEHERRRLPENYGKAIDQVLNTIDDIYDTGIDKKKNLAPYDHRTAVGTAQVFMATVTYVRKNADKVYRYLNQKRQESVEDKDGNKERIYKKYIENIQEVQTWVTRTERDAKYLAGFVDVTVGQSASLPYHFDVVMQLRILNDERRSYITEDNLEKMISKKMPGLELDRPGQPEIIRDRGIGLDVFGVAKSTKPGVIGTYVCEYKKLQGDTETQKIETKLEISGLKELGTDLQDDSFEARMKAAAISQCDLRDGIPHDKAVETCFMGKNFNEDDFLFYKTVFSLVTTKKTKYFNESGEEKVEPAKKFRILAPHVTGRSGEIKLADSRLEAILVTNAVRKMEEISGKYSGRNDEASLKAKNGEIIALANTVIDVAKDRVRNWDSRADTDIVSRMAVLVTRQGFLQDYSFMHAYRYCWKYEWECDKESGRLTKIDHVEIAPVLSRSGDLASLYFFRRALDYDKGSKSRTPWMLPSSEPGRVEASQMPYDRMPKVYKSVEVRNPTTHQPVYEKGRIDPVKLKFDKDKRRVDEDGFRLDEQDYRLDKDGKRIVMKEFVFDQDEWVYRPKAHEDGSPIINEEGVVESEFRYETKSEEEGLKNGLVDGFLRDQLNFLFGESTEARNARRGLGYEFGFSKKTAEKLKEWAVRWRTPFNTKFVEENSDKDIVVPVFMPGLTIANFFEAITDGEGKLNEGGAGGKSVWTKLVESQAGGEVKKTRISGIGLNPEERDGEPVFNMIEDLLVNRWLIDQNMAANYMNTLINTFDKERDSFYALVTGKPSTLGPKDIVKKMVLTFRDAENSFSEEYEIALIPLYITLAVAGKYGISSPGAWIVGPGATNTRVEGFSIEMAEWKRDLKWLSSDRPGDEFRYEKIDIRNLDSSKYEAKFEVENGIKKFKGFFDKVNGNPVPVDDKGFRLEKDKKTNKLTRAQIWKYGESLALMTEFYEPILLRLYKSTAEEAYSSVTRIYQNTATRINNMPFMGKGNLTRKLSTGFTPLK